MILAQNRGEETYLSDVALCFLCAFKSMVTVAQQMCNDLPNFSHTTVNLKPMPHSQEAKTD